MMFDLTRIQEAYTKMLSPSKSVCEGGVPKIDMTPIKDDVPLKADSEKIVMPKVDMTPVKSVAKDDNSIEWDDETERAYKVKRFLPNAAQTIRDGGKLDAEFLSSNPKVVSDRVRDAAINLEDRGAVTGDDALAVHNDLDAGRTGDAAARMMEIGYNKVMKPHTGVEWANVTNSPAAHLPFERANAGKPVTSREMARAFDAAQANIQRSMKK